MGVVTDSARKLRRLSTKAEKIFWTCVRNRQIDGIRFNRQHPICFEYEDRRQFFVADFYCAKYKLIIEIDGKIHDKQKEQDEYRTHILNTLGYKVIRFRNDEILNEMDSVSDRIRLFLE